MQQGRLSWCFTLMVRWVVLKQCTVCKGAMQVTGSYAFTALPDVAAGQRPQQAD
jgi:hypothetical protein